MSWESTGILVNLIFKNKKDRYSLPWAKQVGVCSSAALFPFLEKQGQDC